MVCRKYAGLKSAQSAPDEIFNSKQYLVDRICQDRRYTAGIRIPSIFRLLGDWCAEVLKEYPNFNIVGECWYGTEAGSAYWQRNTILDPKRNSNLKTVMDFPLQEKARYAFTSQTDANGGLNILYDRIAMDFMYSNPMDVLTFLDNHDTDRFLLSMPENLGIF